jgi:hypothetical protein
MLNRNLFLSPIYNYTNKNYKNVGTGIVENKVYLINYKLKVFFKKLKYTKYYTFYNKYFYNTDLKLYRIKKKRKNNRELRR